MNSMDGEGTGRPATGRGRFLRAPLFRAAAVALLAWLAVVFLIQDPLHYLLDRSPEGYGRFWETRNWLLVHIIGGMLALIAGPFQFSSRLRERFPRAHRWNGRVYITGILLAGAPALYLAFFAPVRSFGVALFFLSGAWLVTTGIALRRILRGEVLAHRRWMRRSYVITFAFVTFRWLALSPFWEPFGVHREAVATWIAWTVPLLLLEVFWPLRASASGVPEPPARMARIRS